MWRLVISLPGAQGKEPSHSAQPTVTTIVVCFFFFACEGSPKQVVKEKAHEPILSFSVHLEFFKIAGGDGDSKGKGPGIAAYLGTKL